MIKSIELKYRVPLVVKGTIVWRVIGEIVYLNDVRVAVGVDIPKDSTMSQTIKLITEEAHKYASAEPTDEPKSSRSNGEATESDIAPEDVTVEGRLVVSVPYQESQIMIVAPPEWGLADKSAGADADAQETYQRQ